MKKICVVYRNRRNPTAIAWLDSCLKRVYEDYVEVEDCFMDELVDGVQLAADAFLVISSSLLPKLRRHTETLKNVVPMTRSIKKEYLPAILAIPTGMDVLLVNDTLQSSEEMVLMFYELGIGHLNLIPYDKAREEEGAYRDLRYAITPNEPQMMPPYIEHVINTEYREIGFDSMVQLMDVLSLNNARVTYNLIKYISNIIEPMQGYRASYFSSFLKERMLNEYVYDSAAAVLAADAEERVVYCNRRAQELFALDSSSSTYLERCLPPPLLELIRTERDVSQHLLSFGGVDYLVDKTALLLGEETLGFLITLQDEIVLKSIETSFNKHLREKGLYARHYFRDIHHISESMNRCIGMAQKAAVTDYTILIGGESGTGKELLAQAIHNYSERKSMPFIAVNCAAISESLLESELFGYEEGAFTGARKKGKLGYFEQANRGTIFLDEIGDISPRLQQGLLRVLQERQIMKVGSDKIVDIDVRIIAATNRDLFRAVQEGHFRKDLYYRLNAIAITLPPLRERREDIPLLFRSFMGKFDARLTNAEREAILHYDWPGNVRELENCALYYKTLGELPRQLFSHPADTPAQPEKPRDIAHTLLALIASVQAPNHGAGRSELLHRLRAQGLEVSDGYLRSCLHELEDAGLVVIGRGRRGTSLTALGQKTVDDTSCVIKDENGESR